ncbi:hypothetical protein [Amycolatopsis taiwanensis]|uniref:Uncharacterized protein n=1 Tax=Amycolatopsis taiwanensis TaxID=342230 RepID=A0A9W6R446_9PSEU|nr:hypothetical protein [Amycolatopsis taiwanensis]GLY68218.1 hypothetical protein Atai01_48370 [Amycolatopsis taiwanensis]
MAKKLGKRRKPEPRDAFGAPPPRHPSGPPASSTPLADYLALGGPGVDENYVVVPRSLAESMPLPWQQQLANLLSHFHEVHRGLSWPVYRVVPSRYEKLVDLDEEQLAEAGYLVEIDADGDMVYRERSGRKVEDPQNTSVLVSCLDPIPRRAAAGQQPPSEPPPPVPMNLPPAPVWRSTPRSPSPAVPPLPEPPKKVSTPREPAPLTAQSAPVALPPIPESPPGGDATAPTETVSSEPLEPSPATAPNGPDARGSVDPVPPAAAETTPAQSVRPATEPAPPVPPATQVPEPVPSPIEQPAPPVSVTPPTAEIPAAPVPDADADTPPHGLPLKRRGWFDEPPDDSSDTSVQFGPTGESTEIPYRYRAP